MIPAKPIVITLLLVASAGGARALDQTGAGLQVCIDNARQTDATCAKLTNDPAQRLDCFQRARDEQLACLQRALPDVTSKTTTMDGDHSAQPREPAPKAATSGAPTRPSPPENAQSKAPDNSRRDRPVQGTAPANPQGSPQETAQKHAPDTKKGPDNSASNVAEPSASSTTSDAPADTASIAKAAPAPQQPATPTVESPLPARQADAISEPTTPEKASAKDAAKDVTKEATKAPAKTDAPASITTATPTPQPPATPTAESSPPARQADTVSEPKTPAKDSTEEATKAPAKTDAPADTATSMTTAAPTPQPPATPTAESSPPARQADAVSEPKTPAKDSAKDSVKDATIAPAKTAAPADMPASTATATPAPQPPATPTVQSAPPPRQADAVGEPKDSVKVPPRTSGVATKPPESSWVVSETTSPIDYRPLLMAVIRPTSSSEGGPSGLTVRCLGGQTALSIHTEGAWRAPHKNALPVDHQINDQSVVRQMWTLSADAKNATYTGDPVALLRLLPEGTRLTINVPDSGNARHEATFMLAGLEAVRKRIGTACKWPKADAQASSGR